MIQKNGLAVPSDRFSLKLGAVRQLLLNSVMREIGIRKLDSFPTRLANSEQFLENPLDVLPRKSPRKQFIAGSTIDFFYAVHSKMF